MNLIPFEIPYTIYYTTCDVYNLYNLITVTVSYNIATQKAVTTTTTKTTTKPN